MTSVERCAGARRSLVGSAALRDRAWLKVVAIYLVSSLYLVHAAQAAATTQSPSRTTAAVNRASMPHSAAFSNVGQQPGLKIWRIENFEAKPYPERDYGKFHTGDSYIVLFTKRSNSGALSWDIHFWLGNETSQDEAGTAAILSVDLDDSLGGAPVQHREVQDHESQLFLSHFPSGVRYMPGGVASGFTHVDPNAPGAKRLFQVKGRRNVRVRQIPVTITAMNKGDCFILDVGKEIYVYTGQNSKRTERLKAIDAANQIRDQDHAGRAKVEIIDQYSSESDVQKFFTALGGGSRAQIPAESAGGDDDDFEKNQDAQVKLYKVSDESGSMKVEAVSQKPLNQNMLNSGTAGGQDCFILDTVSAGLFVWVGRQCNKNEKSESMKKAQQFLTTNNYPQWTSVTRVVEGAENAAFKQYFSGWRSKRDVIGVGRIYSMEQIAASMPEPDFNPSTLHADKIRLLAKSAGRAFGFMPDDGTGKAEVYRVENFELQPIKNNPGFFFGGDSYVIKYTYQNKNGRESYIIYFWQGRDSTQDEKAASAIHAVRLDNELGGRAVQVRVTQGNEPRHFLRIFQGRMVVFMGGHASGFKNLRDHDTYDVDGTMLFQVRGSCPEDVRAVQVEEKASSLNSDDSFFLVTPGTDFLWYGKQSSPEERDMASNIAKLLAPDSTAVPIEEGSEPAKFWSSLGGQGKYISEAPESCMPLLPARLFHCQIPDGGKLKVEEIDDFKQQDLDEDDVMVLDSGDEIYVWVGKDATQEEKDSTMKMAEAYLKSDPTDRSHDMALIYVLRQGEEDKSFTSLFPSWQDGLWESLPSYQDVKDQIAASNAAFDD